MKWFGRRGCGTYLGGGQTRLLYSLLRGQRRQGDARRCLGVQVRVVPVRVVVVVVESSKHRHTLSVATFPDATHCHTASHTTPRHNALWTTPLKRHTTVNIARLTTSYHTMEINTTILKTTQHNRNCNVTQHTTPQKLYSTGYKQSPSHHHDTSCNTTNTKQQHKTKGGQK